jgi:hypothetical protein
MHLRRPISEGTNSTCDGSKHFHASDERESHMPRLLINGLRLTHPIIEVGQNNSRLTSDLADVGTACSAPGGSPRNNDIRAREDTSHIRRAFIVGIVKVSGSRPFFNGHPPI